MGSLRLVQLFGGLCFMYLYICEIILVPGSDALVKISRTCKCVCWSSLLLQSSTSRRLREVGDFERPSIFLDHGCDDKEDGISFLLSDDDHDDVNDKKDNLSVKTGLGRERWKNLQPMIKKRLIEKGQAKAIAKKKRREPGTEKKRCMMMKFKELQRVKKLDSRVKRPLGFEERAPLSVFVPGMEITGTVISLTNYGAYVDVGTECDGLLHISQITRKFFVEHPRQVLIPGDEVTVRIRSISPELKKIQLTMLDRRDLDDICLQNDENGKGTSLEELEIYDELWGELKRVTDFGSYVEVGAEVYAFLHFMDHPLWEASMVPSEFMERGQRVRVWVTDLDLEKKRIRVTGCRPQNLPGPIFEL